MRQEHTVARTFGKQGMGGEQQSRHGSSRMMMHNGFIGHKTGSTADSCAHDNEHSAVNFLIKCAKRSFSQFCNNRITAQLLFQQNALVY
jgi:hypothetical protein